MKLPFSLFLALRYLKPKRTFLSIITLISVIGVMLGVMVLILVGSLILLQRQNHEPAAHQTGYGVVFIKSVLNAGDSVSATTWVIP